MGPIGAEFADVRVDHHSVEPRPHSVAGRDRGAEPPGPEKGVLHRFLGVGAVVEDQVGGAERGGVAILDPGSEVVIGPRGFGSGMAHTHFDARRRQKVRGAPLAEGGGP